MSSYRAWFMPLIAVFLAVPACGIPHDHGPGGHTHDDAGHADSSWSATAWGDRFEIFAEVDPLIAGAEVRAHVHVTRLEDFSPLVEGSVALILSEAEDREERFVQKTPSRPGIFPIGFRPERAGEHRLTFWIEAGTVSERIEWGSVRVGTTEAPGGPLAPPETAAQAVAFLKEQQWRTDFATAWAERDTIPIAVKGPARLTPAAGGEVLVTAPLDGVVLPESWPHVGAAVRKGHALFVLIPRSSDPRTLAERDAVIAELESELEAVRARSRRLEQLLALEAVSRAEVESAAARQAALEARLRAARRDRETLAALRGEGGEGADRVAVAAAIDGRVAQLSVTPGQSVAAGQTLARIVRTDPLWVEVALRPEEAARLSGRPEGLLVGLPGSRRMTRVESRQLGEVARSPEVDRATGTVSIAMEVRGFDDPELRPGAAAVAELLLDETRAGVVVPESALVDDGGVEVVYVQLGGEAFLRVEVRVLERRAGRALVDGLAEGLRVVTRGGGAIRRASLLSAGAVEGHVH